jgi:hypothetical protein
MAQTDVQKDRCRNQADWRPLPEVMQTASQLGCRSVRAVTQSRPTVSATGRQVYTFIFLHFWTVHVAEPRPLTASGRRRPGPALPIHVNDFSEAYAQLLTGMGMPADHPLVLKACRFRAWPRRTSSRGSRADRRSARHRLRPRRTRSSLLRTSSTRMSPMPQPGAVRVIVTLRAAGHHRSCRWRSRKPGPNQRH